MARFRYHLRSAGITYQGAGLEAPTLLGFRDVKKEFDDRRPLICQCSFEAVDVLVPTRPPLLRNEVVDPDDQYVFVVAPIEHCDLA